jgi:hypothetical protein
MSKFHKDALQLEITQNDVRRRYGTPEKTSATSGRSSGGTKCNPEVTELGWSEHGGMGMKSGVEEDERTVKKCAEQAHGRKVHERSESNLTQVSL